MIEGIEVRGRNMWKKPEIPTRGEFRQSEQLKHLMKVKEDQQRGVVDAIKNAPASVPVDPTHGYIQGQVLQLLQEQRKHVEEESEIMTTVEAKEKLRVCHMKFCAVQWGSGEEEQLQTVTVPLHKVRMEKEKWYDSMLAEYKSLTEEAKAIRRVKRPQIDPEAELVP
jgi:hypothetical protein